MPATGNDKTLAATCDKKTTDVSNNPGTGGTRTTTRSVAADPTRPVTYQTCVESERSTGGAHKNRQTTAEVPIAMTAAVVATGTPARVKMNGNVTLRNPLLMPKGNTRKKYVSGEENRRSPSLFCRLENRKMPRVS